MGAFRGGEQFLILGSGAGQGGAPRIVGGDTNVLGLASVRSAPDDGAAVSDFRKRPLKVMASLFVKVLELAEKASLVKLGHVRLDGAKMGASASKHKAMS
jgi:hypothetical protein